MRAPRGIARHRVEAAAAALAAVVIGASGLGAGVAAAAQTSPAAAVQVSGSVVRLADEPSQAAGAGGDHEDSAELVNTTALRTDDGTFVPVTGGSVERLEGGTRVTVTAQVPQPVVAAARAQSSTAAPDGSRVSLDRDDLREATGRAPAPATSQLSKATVAAAASSGTALRTTSARVAAAAPTTYTRGTHELTIAVVAPRGLAGATATEAQLKAQVANASAYWSQLSGGGITLRVARISPRYVSAFRCGDDVFAMWSEAAAKTGFVEGPNKHLVMSFPKEAARAGCPYGLASIGSGVNSGGVNIVSDTAWPVLAHEIGHNFGLGHAKALSCGRADANLASLPAGCRLVEYGYPWDVMAASAPDSAGMLSSAQAARVGLMSSADIVEVGDGSRTVDLKAMSSGTGVRAVRVRDPKSSAVYYVEYRVRTGRDLRLYQNVPNGVRVLQVDPTSWQQRGSVTLDATPTGKPADVTRQVPVGSTFRSFSGGVSVSVVTTGTTTRVRVSSGAAAATTARPRATPLGVTVSAPSIDALAATGPRATVSWRGGAARARYDVQYAEVGVDSRGKRSVSSARTWLRNTSAIRAVFKGPAGTTYRFRTRVAGTSTWSAWRSVTFAVDANARGYRASRGWAVSRAKAAYGGTATRTSTRGAWITRPAVATNRVTVLGTKHARGGVARVYVDGKLRATVRTAAPKTRHRQVLASIPVPWGRHDVKVVNASPNARTSVVVEAFAYGR